MTKIVFVDQNDHVIGAGSIAEAVEKGIVHRITRVYVFNSKGQLLLQKRALGLRSAPGKWDDSAAGHVDEGEEYLPSARRELAEEMGVKDIELTEVAKYYTEEPELGSITTPRKRFNALYTTVYDGPVAPDKSEVAEALWIDMQALREWMQKQPDDFTRGFRSSFARYSEHAVV